MASSALLVLLVVPVIRIATTNFYIAIIHVNDAQMSIGRCNSKATALALSTHPISSLKDLRMRAIELRWMFVAAAAAVLAACGGGDDSGGVAAAPTPAPAAPAAAGVD